MFATQQKSAVSNHLPHVLGKPVRGCPLPACELDRVGPARASMFVSTVIVHRVSPPHPQPLSPVRNASTPCVPNGGEGGQNQKVAKCRLGRWYAPPRFDHSRGGEVATPIKSSPVEPAFSRWMISANTNQSPAALNAFSEKLQAGSDRLAALEDALLESIRVHPVGDRKPRVHPREIKRRPKPYKFMTRPRHAARRSAA